MHRSIRRLFALLLVLGITPVVLANESADRAAIEAAAQAWIKAFNARDADTLVALTTEDVVLLDATLAPVSGHKAAHGVLQRAVGASTSLVTTATKEIVIAGDVAWRIGAFTHKPPPNGFAPGHGQSLEIWKRVNGQWKMHRQMSSTLLAQPKPSPPSEPVLDRPTN
jgi:ketosteroid isomerase-like protein